MLTTSGSSPRVWGTQLKIKNKLKKNQLIPTRVGNTSANGT